jgi:hypothetical protein
VHALHSWMSELDYSVEPDVECLDNDPNDAAYVQATATIKGYNAVEEYVACKMYPLVTSISFDNMAIDTMPMSKVKTPLPMFVVENVAAKHTNVSWWR